ATRESRRRGTRPCRTVQRALARKVVAGRRAAWRAAACERLERDRERAATEAASARGTITKGSFHDQPGTTAIRRSPHGSKSRSSRPPAIRAPDSRRAVSPQCQARTRAGGEPFVRISY